MAAKDQQRADAATVDGSPEVVETPIDAVAASEAMVAKVAGHGFDTFPNQFAEEIANQRALADARAQGAREGLAARDAELARRPGGVSHLREIARQEAAKAYQEEYDRARRGDGDAPGTISPDEQAAAVKAAVAEPTDRPS